MTQALLLITSTPPTAVCEQQQRMVEHWLTAYKCAFQTLDGCVSSNREIRENLFAVSGVRANYPQLFVASTDKVEFIGTFDALETMVEAESLPRAVLADNPQITTFSKAIGATTVVDAQAPPGSTL